LQEVEHTRCFNSACLFIFVWPQLLYAYATDCTSQCYLGAHYNTVSAFCVNVRTDNMQKWRTCLPSYSKLRKKHRGLSSGTNYTNRETAACRRS
jgi:hypothetical protein